MFSSGAMNAADISVQETHQMVELEIHAFLLIKMNFISYWHQDLSNYLNAYQILLQEKIYFYICESSEWKDWPVFSRCTYEGTVSCNITHMLVEVRNKENWHIELAYQGYKIWWPPIQFIWQCRQTKIFHYFSIFWVCFCLHFFFFYLLPFWTHTVFCKASVMDFYTQFR